MQGGKSGPEERTEGSTCGANFSYNTWFAGGRSAYIRGLQKEKSHIEYMQFVIEKTTYIRGFPARLITYIYIFIYI
jgi:hypothetical protein